MRVGLLLVLLLAGCTAPEVGVTDIVRSQLRDPDSAKFSSVTVIGEGENRIACGWVNSKNGFGGYTGDQPFMLRGKRLWISDSASPDMVGTCCNVYASGGEGWPDGMVATCDEDLPEPIVLP